MKWIERAAYMDFLERHRERSIIKVVAGVRRCGKCGGLEGRTHTGFLPRGRPERRRCSACASPAAQGHRSCRLARRLDARLPFRGAFRLPRGESHDGG